MGPNTETKILMDGLTTQPIAGLIPLAKSWLSPPRMEVVGDGYQNGSYDPTQRAYTVTRAEPETPATLKLTFNASAASPLYDPAIVIKNWGEGAARLEINGKPVTWGRSYREGYVRRLRGTDLVVWMQRQSTAAFHVEVVPTAP